MALRHAAIEAMDGRKWYEGPVKMDLTIHGPERVSLVKHAGGVSDTLDGSQGPNFIYLPIAYLDDCQIVACRYRQEAAAEYEYEVTVRFL
jgi:hypothetical protein